MNNYARLFDNNLNDSYTPMHNINKFDTRSRYFDGVHDIVNQMGGYREVERRMQDFRNLTNSEERRKMMETYLSKHNENAE